MSKNDFTPAFPNPQNTGMTLRDWFAGKALSGLLSCGSDPWHGYDEDPENCIEPFCEYAYKYADAMMKERTK